MTFAIGNSKINLFAESRITCEKLKICDVCCSEGGNWNGKYIEFASNVDLDINGKASLQYKWNGLFGLGVLNGGVNLEFSASGKGNLAISGRGEFCPPIGSGFIKVCSDDFALVLNASILAYISSPGYVVTASLSGSLSLPVKFCVWIDRTNGNISGYNLEFGKWSGGIQIKMTVDRPIGGDKTWTKCLIGSCTGL